MKKSIGVLLVLLLVCSSLAFAEEFSMRNGVTFGMTLAEIEKAETFSRDTSKNQDVYMYRYGKIAGIDNSGVE